MAKLVDHDFGKLNPELVDFKDEVRDLLNYGKFQLAVVSAAPTYSGHKGEAVLFLSGTGGALYFYTGVGWNAVTTFTATTG